MNRLAALAVLIAAACGRPGSDGTDREKMLITTTSGTNWGGTPVVQPIIPSDSRGNNQNAFNNLAWQQFIALNWVADPNYAGQPDTTALPASFGMPLDQRPVVWESFKEASEVFQANAAPPRPWRAPRGLPAAMAEFAGNSNLKATSRHGLKGLYAPSKFTGGPQLDLSEFQEAFARGAWLTAQAKMNNYITLFEKRLNEDEFNYINMNHLYDADIQQQFAADSGINLPDGSAAFASYGTVGAIEVKAAWIQLNDSTLWPLFKTSKAYVTYPSATGPTTPALVTVGLVALHIIRKTPNAQQFAWSTFEHVNNAPSIADIQKKTLKAWYTYFNAACDSLTDPYRCVQNHQPVPGKDSYSSPVQVVRTTPISSTTANNIMALNANTWATIAAANPQSVFLNYQLVNVLWPNNNTSIPKGDTIPLTDGGATPPQAQQPVANTVLETYHQNIFCLACHASAAIAQPGASRTLIRVRTRGTQLTKAFSTTDTPQIASDYSFLFSEAQSKPTANKVGPKR